MSVAVQAERTLPSKGWRGIETGNSRVNLSYTGDGDGGTIYVLQVRLYTSGAASFEVAQKHIPAKARLLDADTFEGHVYFTYHFNSSVL